MIFNKQIKVKTQFCLKIKIEKCFKTSKQRQNKTLLTSSIAKKNIQKHYCLTIVDIYERYVDKI